MAGIVTALMGLIWGGVSYIFVTVAVASFIAFILNKVHKKEVIIYSSWIIFAFSFMFLLSNRFALRAMLVSLDSGLASIIFFVEQLLN